MRKNARKKKRFVVKKKSRAVLRIAMIAGGAVAAVLLTIGIINLVKKLSRGTGSLEELPFEATANYTYTGSGFLYFADGRLCYNDLTDRKKDTTYKINTEELKLTASSGLAALYNEAAVQVVSLSEPLATSGKVLDVKCGSEYIAVLQQDGAGDETLVVFDKLGQQADSMDFSEVELIDFGFSALQGNTLWTMEMDLTAQTPITTVTTYNLSTKRTTGVMSVHGQLVGDIVFTNRSIFLSCTGDVIRYNIAGSSEAYRTSIYGWELSDSAVGDSVILVYTQRGGGSVAKIYIMPEGYIASPVISSITLPKGALSAFMLKNRLTVYTPGEVYSYSTTGKLLSQSSLPVTIDSATKLSDTCVLLSSGDRLYIAQG